ncbi:MAG: lipopolysaccharide kinase InaA family protein [Pseudomonadales bacterium]
MSGPAPYLDPDDLVAAGRDVPDEFRCRLTWSPAPAGSALGDAGVEIVLRCERILRLLPGRRLVAQAQVDGRRVVLKLFLGVDAARYRRREAHGCELLAAAGVATPALLGRVSAAGANATEGLLFEYLNDARPLRAGDGCGVVAAAAQLARLHQAGCRHEDLHLDNFLLCGDTPARVALIDGDGVRRVLGGRPLGRRGSIDNLAVLCAQRSPLEDEALALVHAAYADQRGWRRAAAADQAGVAALTRATRRQRRARLRRYLRKVQRECSEYLCRRSWRHYLVRVRAPADPALDALLADPEAVVRGGELLKAGNSATVVRARAGAGSYIVKRYNQKNWRHAVRRALKPIARFRRAWVNGQGLHFLDIPTARPLALLERRFGPLRGVAYLVMEDLGQVDLAAEVAAQGASDRRVAQVVRLFQALRAAGISHGDTKASNFMVAAAGVALVDLDAVRLSTAGQAEDLRRFLANFADQPEVHTRFVAAFAAAGIELPAAQVGGVARPPRRL